MFYAASKTLWFLIQPSSAIALMILVGIGLCFTSRAQRAGRRLALTGLVLLLICGLSPLANFLMLPLENRIERAVITPNETITGIIILGGFENGRISSARPGMALNEAGERIAGAVVLAHRYPSARVVFTGGAGKLFREELSGAPAIAKFLTATGINATRITLEDQSRNTFENATLTKALIKPRPGDRWLLITSAFHMPRALGCFRKAGFNVLPWPVDYRTKNSGDLARPFDSIAKGLKRLDLAAKEWIGLVVYRLSGRTTALLPR